MVSGGGGMATMVSGGKKGNGEQSGAWGLFSWVWVEVPGMFQPTGPPWNHCVESLCGAWPSRWTLELLSGTWGTSACCVHCPPTHAPTHPPTHPLTLSSLMACLPSHPVQGSVAKN